MAPLHLSVNYFGHPCLNIIAILKEAYTSELSLVNGLSVPIIWGDLGIYM